MRRTQLVANVITALLTFQLLKMLVEVNDPVSCYLIEWHIFRGLMTSSAHLDLHVVLLSMSIWWTS